MWKNACVPHLCSERVCLCNKKTKKAREMRKFVNLIASHTTHTPFFVIYENLIFFYGLSSPHIIIIMFCEKLPPFKIAASSSYYVWRHGRIIFKFLIWGRLVADNPHPLLPLPHHRFLIFQAIHFLLHKNVKKLWNVSETSFLVCSYQYFPIDLCWKKE